MRPAVKERLSNTCPSGLGRFCIRSQGSPPPKGTQRIHGSCPMSTSTTSFSQDHPITSMEPALRLRMRGDLLGRPGPSEGWGEVCSARSGSSDAFPGHRFSMLPWSVFISSFCPTTGTDRSVNGLQPPNPRLPHPFTSLYCFQVSQHLVPKCSSPKPQHSDSPQKRRDGIHSQLGHCLLPQRLSLPG